jgi:ribose 5-phosphate isomerase A
MSDMNAKKLAAEKAVNFIEDGMTVGLGSGTTASFAIEAIMKLVAGGLSITAVASSIESENLARNAGIKLVPFSELKTIDLYIDGADEVDKDLNLLKGKGGALLREKILAFNSREFIVVIDSSKLVDHLGEKNLLPVEVIPFAIELTISQLKKLGCPSQLRMQNGSHYITDNGNMVVDCAFNKIADVEELDRLIKSIPGTVETGLFPAFMVSKIIVGYENGELKFLENN